MLSGVLTPAFLQSAGRAGKGKNVIRFMGTEADPSKIQISADGNVDIISTKNGEIIKQTIVSPYEQYVSIQADANTTVEIVGNVTFIQFDGDSEWSEFLKSVDTSENKVLETLQFEMCTDSLERLDLSKNSNLKSLTIHYCTKLNYLDIRNCTQLIEIMQAELDKITTIYCIANNEDVASSIATMIVNSTINHGTAYCNSTDTYYQMVADACTSAQWTILPLPA